MITSREAALTVWARQTIEDLGIEVGADVKLKPASDDASFRRYFRGVVGGTSYIFMDAPPELEDSQPFVRIAGLLRASGINTPRIYGHDLGQGFIMLADFGDRLYLDEVQRQSSQVDALYQDALDTIVRMQRMPLPEDLAPYDEGGLRKEMDLFTDWFLPRQLEIETSQVETKLIEQVFRLMVSNAEAQPARFVHRDYHSRNLMVVEDHNPGVIDFQDGVIGPISYDLVSLLRDCYHRFPGDWVARRVEDFRLRLLDEQVIDDVSADEFLRWFDLMGMQRHIKVAGIFSRLNLRDGKPGYLGDIPLVVSYIVEVASRYEDLAAFATWLEDAILPRLEAPEFRR